MVEIVKAPSVLADTELAGLLDSYDAMIGELSPRNATAVWERAGAGAQDDVRRSDAPPSRGDVNLRLSDAYSQTSKSFSETDLHDVDGMLDRISRLVGDLVYQEGEQLLEVDTLAQLASFAPGRLCSRFAERDAEIALPSAEDTRCAVLFADISGFTSLTERLAEKGAVGAEELTAALNRYFGQLIDIIDEFGGDVLKFAGDALLATFEDRRVTAENRHEGEDLTDASARATAASLVIQKQMLDFPEVEGTKLSLKIGLAAGDLRMLHLGGVFGRCELLMVGEPLRELGDANDLAGPGDIIAAASLWNRIDELADGAPLQDGAVRVMSLSRPADDFKCTDSSGQSILTDAPFRADSIAAIRGYIPAAIYSRLAAGQTDWLGELRKVTVVFANLPGFNIHTRLDDAQKVMTVLQQTIYHFEGSLNKLSVDDKGVSLLAGFGLPPVAHEDDAARAIGAALALKERINELGWECSIGVATGRIFCGAYGNEERREYTMIGDTVNTSARLMQAAKRGILSDQMTHAAAMSQFDFATLDPLSMKGKKEPVACFRPIHRRAATRKTSARQVTVFGRKAERELFRDLLLDLLDRDQRSLLLLEGDAGIGKSHIAYACAQQAEVQGCRILHGHGDAIDRSTPWFAWRSVFEELLDAETLPENQDELEAAICSRIELDHELRKLLPLMSSVLPFGWIENEWTAQMKGAIRADNTNRLLARLLELAATQQPMVLQLEDLHYFDSASLGLLRVVAGHVPRLLTLATSRPLPWLLPKELRAVVSEDSSHQVTLGPLAAEDSVRMVERILGVERMPRPVEKLVRLRTQGRPLYVEELAYALRDTGTVSVTDGVAKLVGDLEEFEAREVSGSLEGVIINRVDRLPPAEQLTLKVASVVGYEFVSSLLHDVFPIEKDRQHLETYLSSLDQSKLIRSVAGDHGAEHSFRNRTLRDVAYNLVLVKHRTELHAEIAAWIEDKHAADLDSQYPRLAEHWQQAGNLSRAIECLEAAGQNALINNANREAVTFYRKTLELAEQISERFDRIREGRWHRKYGEALYRVGEVPASMRELRKALRLLGHADSESIIGQLINGNVEMVRQFATRIRRRVTKASKAAPNEALLESVRAYERLVEIQYQRTDMPAFLLATFRALNLAERYGFSPELARCYSNVSAMTSAMMLSKAADRYTERAKRVAEKSKDLSTTAYVQTINSVHFIGQGKWEAARETLDQALELCTSIGDHRRWSEATALTLNLSCWSGEWDRLARHARKLCAAADSGLGIQVATWAYGWLLWVESARDPSSAAVLAAEVELRHWLDADEELALADEVLARGGLLFARLRRGELTSALEIADQIENVIGNAQPVAVYLLPVYSALVDLYTAVCVAKPDVSIKRKMISRLRRMQRRLAIFSMLIPISSPLKCLCDGRIHQLKGRTSRARRSLRKGLQVSERYRMPYFSALLEFELGRIVGSEPDGQALTASAQARFLAMGISHSPVSS
jgi:class 3 adenylate cyclase/tetratricopeptide (TPR) repeat protein